MAFAEFYMQTTGSNLNSGSTSSDSASVTETNGDWGNAAANRFTAASGTPFSGVSVGDWASIYLDASTTTGYVAKVTAVNGGGASIDLSGTVKLGTAPSTGASGRSCKIGGAWASPVPIHTFGATTAAESTCINIKAGTYTLSAALTFNIVATGSFPVWYRGYNTTPGDLDAGSTSLSYPVLSGGSNTMTTTGQYAIFSGISFLAARAGSCLVQSGATSNGIRFKRCRFENTYANAAAAAVNISTIVGSFVECWFKVTSSATTCITGSGSIELTGCYLEGAGGATTTGIGTTGATFVQSCTIRGFGSHGIVTSNINNIRISGCTISGNGGDGIRIGGASAASQFRQIIGNLLRSNGGYGINNSGGAINVELSSNAYYNNTSGQKNGFGDYPEFGAITESSDPCVSSSDLHLIPSASGAGAGIPGQWENVSGMIAYPDIGAWQRQQYPIPRSLVMQSIGTY